MSTATTIALWGAIILGAGAVGLVLYLAGRRLAERVLMAKLHRRAMKVQDILQKHEAERFASTDRLLFQLGEVHDLGAVEAALSQVLDRSENEVRPQLRKVYESLGITQRYIKDVRESPKWSERAAAARALGQLGVIEAIPTLVASMRDPHEDARTVKLAAAQALGHMAADLAITPLLNELRTVDEWASPRIAELLITFGKIAVPQLMSALNDEGTTNVRVWAAQILGRIGDVGAVPALITRLKDRSEGVRMSVCEALGRLSDNRAVNELMQAALRDPVPPVRAEAARALGMIGDETMITGLVTLLSDPDYWTRLRAIEAIELIRPKDPWCLDGALRDPSPEVRGRAAIALQRIGMLDQRIRELTSDDRAIVDRAHRTLVEMGRAGLMESLLSYLEHPDFRIRARIAGLLGEVGDPHAVNAILPCLKDNMWPVRARAVEAIGKLHPDNGVEVLLPSLSDEEETVRAATAASVRAFDLQDKTASVDAVVKLFDTANAEVRTSVLEAVGHIDQASVNNLLDRAVVDPNAEVRLRTVKAIAGRMTERWVSLMETRLADPDTRIRSSAAEGLGRLGTAAALQGIVQSLSTPDRQFREALTNVLASQGVEIVAELAGQSQNLEATLALVWTLGKTADIRALPRLGELASRKEAEIRAAVAGALAKIAHPTAEQILWRLMQDRNERVRAAAVNGIASVGTGKSMPHLQKMLNDPDVFVRNRTPLAMARCGTPDALKPLEQILERTDDASYKAHILAAFGIVGGELGFRYAVTAFANPDMQLRINRVLEREPEEVRLLFRQNLSLDIHTQNDSGAVLTAKELAEHYATTLRSSQREDLRIAAVRALETFGSESCRDLLIDTVRTDPSAEVRRMSLSALSNQLQNESVANLFGDALRDPAIVVQIAAAKGLAQVKDARFNPQLLRCFLIKDPKLYKAVVQTLAASNANNLSSFVDQLMGYREEDILAGGAAVLGAIANPAAVGVLIAWLDARSADLRAASLRGLGLIGTIDAKNAVMGCVADPNETVRLASIDALSHLPGQDTLEALTRLSRDPSVRVRLGVATAIGQHMTVALVSLVEVLAQDPEESVRIAALLSLLMLRDLSTLERAVALINNQPEGVRESLRYTPKEHGAVVTLRDLSATDRRAELRIAALRALSYVEERPLAALRKAFSDPDPQVRLAAVKLSRNHTELEEDLLRLAKDPDARIRDAIRKRKVSIIDGSGSASG